ncbi:molybdopterin-guanine dinucleotide biosynthesis protein A [Mucilaginibacter frigoritolerans]|uniref:Probable molybdenum cofactor guanylyltransferase n=1 Tax=Mucilaginibacter frigoritolerans TaxID=652788 RepID=A0A562U4I6_9SPHI|nr:NTP transferase domain-containing protein [Mucilaginibacter frigoritolerans]TWJ00733.1 molybdopterin-guanine dinucleotide biosynthesis protein A [Mucilaginibacter frigoritolerans]
MISKEHKKHTNLQRPAFGNFSRNEWAIVGAPCTTIKLLADQVINALSSKYKCAYADTAHNDDTILSPGRLSNGAALEYTDQVNYRQLDYAESFNSFKLKEIFSSSDLVLVNGNHQQAKAQVVIIYANKKASLHKRIEQLTNVQMILLAEDVTEAFDFVKEAIPNWQQLPLYRLDETEKIISFFETQMQHARPVLNGLVLAGGKSERMGFDKGSVNWHGKEQRYYMADLLKSFCNEVFISCRSDQQKEIDANYLRIADTFTGLGPFGAILSAFREKPDNAWLIIACDLPLIDENTLKYLTANRNVSSIATAYQSTFDDFPEPLITIWEPKSYPVLLSFLAQGYSCPRKVLINSDITLLNAPNPDDLTNVNTQEELDKVKHLLNQKIAIQ